MRDPGRISAAIEVLSAVLSDRRPAKLALKEWGQANRIAGSKDRAWISGLVMDALRRRRSVGWMMQDDAPRGLAIGVLGHVWGWAPARISEAAAEGPHGPGALTPSEEQRLSAPVPLSEAPDPVRGDYPDWLDPAMARVFGEDRASEGAALSVRAPVDLRVNTLKVEAERGYKAIAAIGAEPSAWIETAARVAAPDAADRPGSVQTIPAFSKGWVEVQDLGSQIAAAAAGDLNGAQVLDFCAGGGGKTLALAALMANSGQIYAYDSDARRLMATVHRAQRAGLRNLQLREPRGEAPLSDLAEKLDVVFVDAPCTGSGVWRRQPDAKWRLREGQFARRQEEQDAVLREAAGYVRPGGRLVYVTCSVFAEENEDRLAAFRASHKDFAPASALSAVRASGLLRPEGLEALRPCGAGDGALRLTPRIAGTDGFFISVLKRGE